MFQTPLSGGTIEMPPSRGSGSRLAARGCRWTRRVGEWSRGDVWPSPDCQKLTSTQQRPPPPNLRPTERGPRSDGSPAARKTGRHRKGLWGLGRVHPFCQFTRSEPKHQPSFQRRGPNMVKQWLVAMGICDFGKNCFYNLHSIFLPIKKLVVD